MQCCVFHKVCLVSVFVNQLFSALGILRGRERCRNCSVCVHREFGLCRHRIAFRCHSLLEDVGLPSFQLRTEVMRLALLGLPSVYDLVFFSFFIDCDRRSIDFLTVSEIRLVDDEVECCVFHKVRLVSVFI